MHMQEDNAGTPNDMTSFAFKLVSVVLYTITPLFFGFGANWNFSGPRWNIPFPTSQMRHLEVSGTVHLSTTTKDRII